MRTLILLGLLFCAAAPTAAKDITVTATPVPLNPEDPKQTRVDSLEYVAGFALDSPAPEWGGYSGMVLAPDGSSLLAVSDVGHWLEMELAHDSRGVLLSIGRARIEPLLDEAGQPVAGKEWSDAEEIARNGDGSFLVSFERRHRVWLYAAVGGVPHGPSTTVPLPVEIGSLPENAGLEAITAGRSGQLTLVAEGGADPEQGSRGWIGKEGSWTRFSIERADGFEPTSLAEGPGSSPVLLERRYTEADGPAARISTIGLPFAPRASGFTLGVLRRPMTVDNFEALAIRAAPDGHAFIYLLSDDNQSDQQRTLLLQFRASLD